jgi:YD repeat-containing protein
VYVFDRLGRHLRTVEAMTSVTLLQFEYDAKGRVTTLTDRDGNQTRVERDATGAATAVVAPFGQRTTLSLDGNGLLRSIVDPAGGAVGMTYAKGLLETYTDARGGVHRFEFDPDGRLIKDENPAGGSQSLTRTTTATGFNVDVTTAMGRTTSYRVDFTLGGMMTWTNTAPDGAQAVSTYDGKAWSTVYADGTMSASVEGPDPRFELQAPVDSESTFTTPGGLSKSSQAERSVELSDPANPLALKRLV